MKRPADVPATENWFCDETGLAGNRFFFFSRTWHGPTTTVETKFMVLFNTFDVSQLYNIREANSRAGSSFTDHSGCNTVCAKPTTRVSSNVFLRSKSFSWQGLRCAIEGSASTQTIFQGQVRSCNEWHLRERQQCEHSHSRLGEKVSLRKQGITHEILDIFDCSFQILMLNCTPIERHGKIGMRLQGTPHHKCYQLQKPQNSRFAES